MKTQDKGKKAMSLLWNFLALTHFYQNQSKRGITMMIVSLKRCPFYPKLLQNCNFATVMSHNVDILGDRGFPKGLWAIGWAHHWARQWWTVGSREKIMTLFFPKCVCWPNQGKVLTRSKAEADMYLLRGKMNKRASLEMRKKQGLQELINRDWFCLQHC